MTAVNAEGCVRAGDFGDVICSNGKGVRVGEEVMSFEAWRGCGAVGGRFFSFACGVLLSDCTREDGFPGRSV